MRNAAVMDGARSRAHTLGAWGGLLFAGLVIVQNVVRAAFAPAPGASAADIVDFARHGRWSVHLLVVTYLVGLPALFVWAHGLADRCRDESSDATMWASVGTAGVTVIAVLFALVNVIDVVIVAGIHSLASQPALLETLWRLHDAIFTVNLAAVAVALLGLANAARAGGLLRRGLYRWSMLGSVLLLAGATPTVAATNGFPAVAVAGIGYLAWLALLITTSVSAIRETPSRAAHGTTSSTAAASVTPAAPAAV